MSLPVWTPKRLTDAQVQLLITNIENDRSLDEPLSATDASGWSSKDLGIGQDQVRPDETITTSTSGDVDQSDITWKIKNEHFDKAIQDQAFEFIGSDARIEVGLKRPLRWIKIASIGRTFYHFQLYAAFWLLLEERGIRRGTIHADMMGLGKVSFAPNVYPYREGR